MKSFVIFAALLNQAIGQTCFDDYLIVKQTIIRFDECAPPSSNNGIPYLMEVDEIRLGNAIYNRNPAIRRSIFFVGEPVQICMKGRFRRSVPSGLKSLQASVHGDVNLLGDAVKLKYPFCDIVRDGCPSMSYPKCEEEVVKDAEFCFCSQLSEVPATFDVDADVYWKILAEAPNPTTCEKEFKVDKLLENGKIPLACVLIPAKVKNSPPNFFQSQKSAILSRGAGR